jgi:hypothetical protein
MGLWRRHKALCNSNSYLLLALVYFLHLDGCKFFQSRGILVNYPEDRTWANESEDIDNQIANEQDIDTPRVESWESGLPFDAVNRTMCIIALIGPRRSGDDKTPSRH